MSELPENWASANVLELSQMIRGVTYSRNDAHDQPESGLIPILRANNISERGLVFDDLVYVPRKLVNSEQVIKAGDVIIAISSGSISVVGKAKQTRVDIEAGFGAFCAAVRPNNGIEPRYFGHFFNSDYYRKTISSLARGVNINNLKRGHFEQIEVPLAPLPEQKRIADKLDRLLGRVDACQANLERVPKILKRFRQSVLAKAMSGRLTEDWRALNGYFNIGTIGFEFLDADCFGDYEFPATWKPLRLQDIADVIGGITKDSKKQNLLDEEIPYLRVANVQRGYLDLSEMKTIRVPKQRVDDWLLKPGDILFNEGGDIDKLGRGWIWNGEIERCIFQNHVFRARLRESSFVPRYFSYYGNSRGYDYFLRYGKQTTNLASINKRIIDALPIAVPPVDEQQEIVRRVDGLFAHADRLEAHWRAAQGRVASLTPSLLAKAFRGELVEQDPSDEPAEKLLERIRLQRATQPVVKPRRQPQTQKTREIKMTEE